MISGLVEEEFINKHITMKIVKTTLILGLLLSLGFGNSIYAQDKYGTDPNKCKTNLSIFYEQIMPWHQLFNILQN